MNKIVILILGFILFFNCMVFQKKIMASEVIQTNDKKKVAKVEFEIGEILLDNPLETAQLDAVKIMLNSISNLSDQEKLEQLNYIKEKIKNFKLKQEVKKEIKNEQQNKQEQEKNMNQSEKLIYKQGKASIQGYNVTSFPCELSELPKSPIFEQIVENICVKSQQFKYPIKQENFLEDIYLLRYTFYFKAKVAGVYSFVVNEINTSKIYIDNELILPYIESGWNGISAREESKRSFTVELSKGLHYFEIFHSRAIHRHSGYNQLDYNYHFEIFYKAPNEMEPKMISGEDMYLAYKQK